MNYTLKQLEDYLYNRIIKRLLKEDNNHNNLNSPDNDLKANCI